MTVLLSEDVEDDLRENYPHLYQHIDGVLVYQNGDENPAYAVFIEVHKL